MENVGVTKEEKAALLNHNRTDKMSSYTKPRVKLVGEDGNAFAIMARVRKELRKAGASKEVISKYVKEATSGDYDNLLRITIEHVDVY